MAINSNYRAVSRRVSSGVLVYLSRASIGAVLFAGLVALTTQAGIQPTSVAALSANGEHSANSARTEHHAGRSGVALLSAGTQSYPETTSRSLDARPSAFEPRLYDQPEAIISAISCVSSTFCAAVAEYSLYKEPSDLPPALVTWNGTAWSLDTSIFGLLRNGPNSYSYIEDISCVSASFCVAVGFKQIPNVSISNIILTWNGSKWSLDDSSSLSTAPAQDDTLKSVSCASESFCVAVGSYYPTPNSYPPIAENFLLTWNGSTWSLDDASSLSSFTTQSNQLTAVSCASATFCVAVGNYRDTNGFLDGVLLTWNGSTWSLDDTSATSSSTTPHNSLRAVSCTSASFCVAVGPAAILTWNGSAWSLLPTSSVSTPDLNLTGVSCTSTSFCMASGSSVVWITSPVRGTVSQSIALVWNGSTWSYYKPPSPVLWKQPQLLGVSCVSTTFCALDGQYTRGVLESYLLTWNGSTWSLNTSSVGTVSRYWLVASDGGIFTFGRNDGFFGSMGFKHLNAPIVAMAASTTLSGYWLVASDGGIFSFGQERFYGSMGGKRLNAPIVGITSTPDGQGYWLVASDGGIFAYGDARFYGSMGGKRLNAPIVAMAMDPDTGGYWLVASDGGIFAYNAPFYGSTGGKRLNAPIVAIAQDTWTGGYWLVASDGGIFGFNAPFYGSMGGKPLNAPIVGMAAGY